MKKDLKKTKLYKRLYEKIKRELDTVYITSEGHKFTSEDDAICEEEQIQERVKTNREREERMNKLVDIFIDVLEENNWGVFYKTEPIQTLSIQDGSPLLRVNEVDSDVMEKAINELVMKIDKRYLENWEKQKHTQHPSIQENDSNQTKS